MATIIVMKGPQSGDWHVLEPGSNVVGRSPDLAIRLSDMTVSRRHLQIMGDADGGGYSIEDLGSTHGVMINGIRLRKTVRLREGDRISAGAVDLMFTGKDIASREQALAVLADKGSELATINFAGGGNRMAAAGGEAETEPGPRTLLQWAGAASTTLAVAFTDIVASTAMTCRLGNEAMGHKRRAHFARVRSLVAGHDGYEVKSNGDGFMVAFHASVAAVDFACELCADPGDADLKLRVGVHIGPVVVEDDDVQGAAVSYAARLLDQAADGGVWISDEVKNHVDQERAARHAQLRWRGHPDVVLKGFEGPQRLWSLDRCGGEG